MIAHGRELWRSIGQMTEFAALGGKVVSGMRVPRHIGTHSPHNLDSRSPHRVDLFGVIGDQLHGMNSETTKNLDRERIIAQIDSVPKLEICFDRVQAFVLKLVSAEFFNQADTSALLVLINEYSRAMLPNELQRKMKLVMAITPQGMENIAGCALGVNANQGRLCVEVSKGQSQQRLRLMQPLA
jgi:hypothetical protein